MRFNLLITILLFGATSCSHPVSPEYHYGIDSGITTGIRQIWKAPKIKFNGELANGIGGPVQIQPIRSGNRLYVAYDYLAQCYDTDSGKVIWSAKLVDKLGSDSTTYLAAENMFLDNNRLIIVREWKIICFDATIGVEIWHIDPPAEISSSGFHDSYYTSSAQSPDAIFVTSHEGGTLYKISKSTGQILWQNHGALLTDAKYYKVDPGSAWNGSPAYANGRVYVPGRYGTSVFTSSGLDHDGSVACFDAGNGELLWCKVIPPMDKKYTPYPPFRDADHATGEYNTNVAMANIIVLNDTLILKTGKEVTWMDRDGNILFMSGDPQKHCMTEAPNQVRFWQNRLLVLNRNGMPQCYGIDPVTHEFLWTATLSENSSNAHTYTIAPSPAYVGTTVYFQSDDFWVIGIDAISGQRTYALDISHALNDPTNHNQVWDGGFLVDLEHHMYIMDNKFIYCLQMNQ